MTIYYNNKKSTFTIKVADRRIETTVTASGNTVTDWIGHTLHLHQHHLDHLIIGLDVEWCLPRYPGSKAEDPIAVLQIAVGCRCLIFQMLHRDYIPAELYIFLEDERFKICGVGVADDIEKLNRGYNMNIQTTVDLRPLAVELMGREDMKQMGLKRLAKEITGIELEKCKQITLSNWGRRMLSLEQIEYAALDAYTSFEIGRELLYGEF